MRVDCGAMKLSRRKQRRPCQLLAPAPSMIFDSILHARLASCRCATQTCCMPQYHAPRGAARRRVTRAMRQFEVLRDTTARSRELQTTMYLARHVRTYAPSPSDRYSMDTSTATFDTCTWQCRRASFRPSAPCLHWQRRPPSRYVLADSVDGKKACNVRETGKIAPGRE